MFWKNLKLGQKMLLGFGLIIGLMVVVLGYSYINFTKAAKVVEINLHSYETIREADLILTSLVSIETGARGYAITGKEQFLEPFDSGMVDYEQHYIKLKMLTSDNQVQQERLVELQKKYESWIDWETTQLVNGRQRVISGEIKMDNLIEVIQQATGKKEMDNIRADLSDITNEELRLLEIRKQTQKNMENQTALVMTSGGITAFIFALLIAFWITGIVVNPVKTVTDTFKKISEGDANLEVRLNTNSNDEIGQMAKYFNVFIEKLKTIIIENKNQSWLRTGQAELSESMRGDQNFERLAANIITYIAKYLNAQVGTIYFKTDENIFSLYGSYAYKRRKNLSNEIKLGEGIVGQAALEKQCITITNVPEDYTRISSSTGEALPRNILVVPCLYNDEVISVIELGFFDELTDLQMELLELVSESIAISINSVETRMKTQDLLEKTVEQTEELQVQQEELKQSNEELEEQAKSLRKSEAKLQAQQEELKQSNEELEEQTKALKESESRLQSQQEELRVINEELEERTKSLEHQRNDIETKNKDLKIAQQEIEEKAEALEITSKYKSEFLANMSHELRTPLNSILVLSQSLAGKKIDTPITEKQLEYAKTINASGQDLLKLINDILDLAKVEAGKMEINFEPIGLKNLIKHIENSFAPIANEKGLNFVIKIEDDIPEKIISDAMRLQQILNNLLSNAFKFTEKGEVKLSISRPDKNTANKIDGILHEKSICIAISDTGIGIPMEKQKIVFEAFKQSDGTTSRKYGGTGLGLSISRDLAKLLGGKIYLTSEENIGSTFTLVLPENIDHTNVFSDVAAANEDVGNKTDAEKDSTEKLNATNDSLISDDRMNVDKNEKILLVIEDDKSFSEILYDLAHEKGFKCIIAATGNTGIEMATKYKPDAILLDIGLPDINGWKVVEKLKSLSETRSIPVHVISGKELSDISDKMNSILGYIKKPVTLESLDEVFEKLDQVISKPFKRLLILDENKEQIENISDAFDKKGIQITALDNGKEALELLGNQSFDCMILDLKLKDMSGLELLSKLRKEEMGNIPIFIHTETKLTIEEEAEIQRHAESIIIKGSRSVERLVAEASLFLHEVDTKIEGNKIKAIRSNQEKEKSLENKKVLIIDDDMRNVFALSNILEEKGMKVVIGRNGKEGIEKLQQNTDTDIILMDIMMPEMDGYTAMKEIRRAEKYRKLPIIALTAKAMKDDRQKCIDAGASEYLTKPIDIVKLISLLRVWLY